MVLPLVMHNSYWFNHEPAVSVLWRITCTHALVRAQAALQHKFMETSDCSAYESF